LPHRSELIAEHRGVRWINDSKGTNVGATLATVQGLPGVLVLIAGGDGKGQDFSPLRSLLADKLRALVTLGRDAPAIAALAPAALPVAHARDMTHAVALAAAYAQAGDSVVLSPACASFDMFANYEARGAAFSSAVQQYTNKIQTNKNKSN
jgi:UDP-N-acetylmuramoylalanine--D-glutamate ligase